MAMLSVEDIAAHLHSLPDQDGVDAETTQAIGQLARLLSDTVGEAAEDALVSEMRKTGVIGPIVRLLSKHREETQFLHLGLSILVNLADAGGAEIVTLHRGTDLLLELLHSADANATYYAVAGVQNLSCYADCIHLILDAHSDERLRELVNTSTNEHIQRCAAGALSNIRASPQFQARLVAEKRRLQRSDEQGRSSDEMGQLEGGWRPRQWSPRSEQSLQSALTARVKADALQFSERWRAAVVVQAAVRRRLGVRAAQSLRWRERAADAVFFEGEDTGEGVLLEGMEADLAAIVARLEGSVVCAESKEAVSELAHILSEVEEEECIPLIRALARLDAIRLLVRLLTNVDMGAHQHLAHIGVSALVNVADIGGALLVKRDGGLDLLLAQLRAPDESLLFLAAAGLQNVLSTPQMASDSDCMQKLVRCGAEVTLRQLASHHNHSIGRSASGALANLARSGVYKLLKSALLVREHYKAEQDLDVRMVMSTSGSSGAGSCDGGSPRSDSREKGNSFVYAVV
ncbi:hypothetical protein T492DRAFT_1108432 [Pavlovales sp. CCMP2436]|nr:hypothetical protein T492DRAFT_1108777 [Pavlovales sp. CCMP2436]KAJ1616168.1 hypothetical protein T492DRAFT_1108432 [Pavlovales sp. CCMP2436]|mmetsp:Transcript_43450/g.107441  ORF Transcript_43450/g.107441 Transcript_43450/m.107441 type:complete len:517 (+) Transcript_43450:283-1833(+)